MLTLTEFSRKQRSDKGKKRSKSSSLDNTLKKSQVFRNVLNPITNTLREVRGSVKTGLQVAEHIKRHRPKLPTQGEKIAHIGKGIANVSKEIRSNIGTGLNIGNYIRGDKGKKLDNALKVSRKARMDTLNQISQLRLDKLLKNKD